MTEQKPVIKQDWREVPSGEMLDRVIVALDGYQDFEFDRAYSHGEDGRYAEYIRDQLIPFLEAEVERAKREEGAGGDLVIIDHHKERARRGY